MKEEFDFAELAKSLPPRMATSQIEDLLLHFIIRERQKQTPKKKAVSNAVDAIRRDLDSIVETFDGKIIDAIFGNE